MLLSGSDGTEGSPEAPVGASLEGQLACSGVGLGLEAEHHRLELVEVGEVPVDRGELDGRHWVDPGQPALGQVTDLVRTHHGPGAPGRGGDGLRQLLQLLLAHRALARRSGQSAEELLPVERLAAPVALLHRNHGPLGPLVRGEALTASGAFAAPAHRVARLGQT